MATADYKSKSLLASNSRIQTPWIKVTFGEKDSGYTFGIFTRSEKAKLSGDFYTIYDVQYPNYVQSLNITKINGQINQYSLTIAYPITPDSDPNFFEKIFSSISSTRKIWFSYGDFSTPSYSYKDEQAIITNISQTFDLTGSKITYTIKATSSAALSQSATFTFPADSGAQQPSAEIYKLFTNTKYGLQSLFPGMSVDNFYTLVDASDKAVKLSTKTNISVLDYISYLVSCMVPSGSTANSISKDMYILTIHDDIINDSIFNNTGITGGSYFTVTRESYTKEHSDAYDLDIGYNTSTIVTNFSIEDNENYSMYYDYTEKLYPEKYKVTISNTGKTEKVYAPNIISNNDIGQARTQDVIWWTKLTQYPIKATVTVLGLLRPVSLLQYIRLNVIFPGGHKHISSGLYLITKQVDNISESGYQTTLSMTRIGGDTEN